MVQESDSIVLLESASRGEAGAQRLLAERYFYGRGVERCPARAFGWLLLAVRQGDAQAEFLMRRLAGLGLLQAFGADFAALVCRGR